MTEKWERWPSTNDQWVEYVKDAYAAGLITKAVFERSIDRLLEKPDDMGSVMLDMPYPWNLSEALLDG